MQLFAKGYHRCWKRIWIPNQLHRLNLEINKKNTLKNKNTKTSLVCYNWFREGIWNLIVCRLLLVFPDIKQKKGHDPFLPMILENWQWLLNFFSLLSLIFSRSFDLHFLHFDVTGVRRGKKKKARYLTCTNGCIS